MLILLYFVWLSLCAPPNPQPIVPLPHVKAQGLVGSKGSQWQRLRVELWQLLPFSPFLPSSQLLFVTGSDGCLPGCVLICI